MTTGPTNPSERLGELAEAQARALNDPEALRRQLAKLAGDEAKEARRTLDAAIKDGTFNDRFDAQDPELMRAWTQASTRGAR